MSNFDQDDGDQGGEGGLFGELPRRPMNEMPLQPIGITKEGVARFRVNRIVRYLLDAGPFDMNHIACLPDITNAEKMQFSQLIGYSVSGAGDLSYWDDETTAAADVIVEGLLK